MCWDQGPQCHRNKGAQHSQKEHLNLKGTGMGTREPCPGREETGNPSGMGMGTRDPTYAGRGLGMPVLQKQGKGAKHAQVGDKGHHCHRDGDTGTHKQGTKDLDVEGIGTGKLPQGTPMLWGKGHTHYHRNRGPWHTQAGN